MSSLAHWQGAEFWNDSCAPTELAAAIAWGAVGATSNPVIVQGLVAREPERYAARLRELALDAPSEALQPRATGPTTTRARLLTWRLIAELTQEASLLLLPEFERSRGERGSLSAQVSPLWAIETDRERAILGMVEQGRWLATLAPNVSVKVPLTQSGLAAIEELTAQGVRINATVSFSFAQVIACAGAMARGLKRAREAGGRLPSGAPIVTLMVGRLDDHLKRVAPAAAPATLDWAGIAVAKRAHAWLEAQHPELRLLIAAYRHLGHWRELIGPSLIQSLPYAWWTQVRSAQPPIRPTLGLPMEAAVLEGLRLSTPEFVRAYEPEGLSASEFDRFGATSHTLEQFVSGYQKLEQWVELTARG